MPLQISFELSDSDLEHFRAMAVSAQAAVADANIDRVAIASAAREVFQASKGETKLPEFIATRLAKLEVLVEMVDNQEWQLPDEEMTRVYSAMAYFANPDDLIPDRIPGIGFLDDAIMAEIVVENLQDEIEAYEEFRKFRDVEAEKRKVNGLSTDVHKEDWLADKRAVLHSRMRSRRRRRGGGGPAGMTKLF
jgi:uncharacterized membrane protein YkvA (DUF1232 family)